MSERINVNHNDSPIYDIVVEDNFDGLGNEIKSLSVDDKKICIISDTNVAPLYLKKLEKIIKQNVKEVLHFVFDAGESSKNLNTVYDLYDFLITSKFDRKDILIALGGGVVGDLTGFVAATYLRGIKFIQVPTSLLAQVDSSIGGKTGVDFNQYKNMVGSFYHPSLVYININTLNTLPKREFISGMAEVIKHGFIKDYQYYKWLDSNKVKIKDLDLRVLEEMIIRSCLIKKNVVEQDFRETGERALLNFGHTIGHAIEKLKNFSLSHGECVSIGISYALKLSGELTYITDCEKSEAIQLLKDFGLPVEFDNLEVSDIIDTLSFDKKMESGILNFILLKGIGNAIIDRSITVNKLSELLS